MKRAFFLMLLCAILLLTGCAQQPAADDKPAMYIEPTQLTAQEELIKSIASQGRNCNIYDFQLGKEQLGITVSVYRLENNQWELYTGGSQLHLPAQEGKGRFALNFGPLTEGILTSMLDEKSNVMTLRQAPADILYDVSGLNVTTTQLSELAEVHYGEEIPLVLQFISSQLPEDNPNAVITIQPEDLAALGYEHVFFVTAAFLPMSSNHE